jgi:hypothetical protein
LPDTPTARLHAWDGRYVGFVRDGRLFGADGRYLGWLEPDGRVWGSDGRYLGELTEGAYVLRRTGYAVPVPRPPRVPPVPALPPPVPAPRAQRGPRPGWTDALAGVGLLPQAADLLGAWSDGVGAFRLDPDGVCRPLPAGEAAPGYRWQYRAGLLMIAADPDPAATAMKVYQVIDYAGETLVVRLRVAEGHSVPIRLHRTSDAGGPDAAGPGVGEGDRRG